MSKLNEIRTEKAPAAIGPYAQAIVSDGWIFASGQIPLDPESGELVGGDIPTQTHRVMKNLAAVLEAAGSDFSLVVKTTVYLSNMANFAAMNEVYGSYFGAHRSARATVAVAGLPRGVDVEIDLVARVRG